MSFPRLLTAVLCGGYLLLGSAQAQQPGRELRTCKLRLAWWSAPENPPELALQKDKERTPFSPDTMALSQIIEYRGEPEAVILKKTVTAELDKAGKPITQWIPYCSIPVGPNDTDLAVLLFPDEKRGIAKTKVFDFSQEGFPYGTIQFFNFSSAKIAIVIDDNSVTINSRGSARFPKTFTQRTISKFRMAAMESNGEQLLLRSSAMIVRPNSRLLFFILERPGSAGEAKYDTEVIMDNFVDRPKPSRPPEATPPSKGKEPPQASRKKAPSGQSSP
jgi:hypothetical protein